MNPYAAAILHVIVMEKLKRGGRRKTAATAPARAGRGGKNVSESPGRSGRKTGERHDRHG